MTCNNRQICRIVNAENTQARRVDLLGIIYNKKSPELNSRLKQSIVKINGRFGAYVI